MRSVPLPKGGGGSRCAGCFATGRQARRTSACGPVAGIVGFVTARRWPRRRDRRRYAGRSDGRDRPRRGALTARRSRAAPRTRDDVDGRGGLRHGLRCAAASGDDVGTRGPATSSSACGSARTARLSEQSSSVTDGGRTRVRPGGRPQRVGRRHGARPPGSVDGHRPQSGACASTSRRCPRACASARRRQASAFSAPRRQRMPASRKSSRSPSNTAWGCRTRGRCAGP